MRKPILKHGLTALKSAEAEVKAKAEEIPIEQQDGTKPELKPEVKVEEPIEEPVDVNPIEDQVG